MQMKEELRTLGARKFLLFERLDSFCIFPQLLAANCNNLCLVILVG